MGEASGFFELLKVARLETFYLDLSTNIKERKGSGTGFFYKNKDNKLFIITNKHVVYKRGYRSPDRLRFGRHSDPLKALSKIQWYEIPLLDRNGKRLWKEACNKVLDIAAIEIPDSLKIKTAYYSYSDTLSYENMRIGQLALVLGYPGDLYDEFTHLPVARIACVATFPFLYFKRNPYFLVDAKLPAGMSGSPVITYPVAMIEGNSKKTRTQEKRYLMGVFSAEFILNHEPSGLNIVWLADRIEDVTKEL